MGSIATYVFIDLETTGLPNEENNRTKITELSMVAVKREHVLKTVPGTTPRVQHKLTLCFNPRKFIHEGATKESGLDNDLLVHEAAFDMDTFNVINTFLNTLSKPVCLVAHNGLGFDFPILKNHIIKLGASLPMDLLCADTFHAFYDILEANKGETTPVSGQVSDASKNESTMITESRPGEVQHGDEDSTDQQFITMKEQNETTPKQQKTVPSAVTPRKENRVVKARRRFPWSLESKPKQSYKLKDIYERLLKRPAIQAHRAENDCIMTLECSVAVAKDFVPWIDNADNHITFDDVKPMTIGIRLGD